MNTLVSNSLPLPRQPKAAVPSSLAPATRTAIKLLQNIEGGSLRLLLPDGQNIMLGCHHDCPIEETAEEHRLDKKPGDADRRNRQQNQRNSDHPG